MVMIRVSDGGEKSRIYILHLFIIQFQQTLER